MDHIAVKIQKLREYYKKPRLTLSERKLHLTLSSFEMQVLSGMRKVDTKILFILQLALFKKYCRFFEIDDIASCSREISSIVDLHSFPSCKINISRQIYSTQKVKILNILGYKPLASEGMSKLEFLIFEESLYSLEEGFLLKKIIDFLTLSKIAFPQDPSLIEDIIFRVIKKRTSLFIKSFSKITSIGVIKSIHDSYSKNRIQNYLISGPSNNSLKEIRLEIKKVMILKELTGNLSEFLDRNELSDNNIRYYYQVYLIKFRSRTKTNYYETLFLFSVFSLHRERKGYEFFVKSYKFHLQKFKQDARCFAESEFFKFHKNGDDFASKIPLILRTIIDPKLKAKEEFKKVRNKIYQILSEDNIKEVILYLEDNECSVCQFEIEYYKKHERKIQNKLKPLLEIINFDSKKYKKLIREAITYSKSNREENDINPIFETHLQISNKIQSGEIYKNETESFKEFSKDIIDEKKWGSHKENLLKRSGLPLIQIPIEKHLQDLEIELEDLYGKANKMIENGLDPNLKIRKDGTFHVRYKGIPPDEREGLFSKIEQSSISDVIQFTSNLTDFTDAFTHYSSQNNKKIPNTLLTASLVALGTNLGLHKMSKISNFDYQDLKKVMGSYIRLDTLRDANNIISNAIEALPIFKYYHIENNIIYSSSDGQKFETQHDTINARYSSKYFGVGKGIANYSLIAGNVPVNAKIIGTEDYEGHHILDLLLNNKTNILPQTHCSDGHGINQVNFGLLNLFGYQFAPRLKSIHSGKSKLYGFHSIDSYKDLPIRASHKINKRKIIDQWEEIQKIVISLKEKRVSQSIITNKLSQYSKRTPLKNALWEYNNIIKTIFTLNYITSPIFRQNIQKSLNIGENYHQLKRAIAFANRGNLKGKSVSDQEIWSNCARLIANCVIYYNSYILSECLESSYASGNDRFKNMVISSSPISWSHINICGRYEFNEIENYQLIDDNLYESFLQ